MDFLSSMKASADCTCGRLMLKKNEMEEKQRKTMMLFGKPLGIIMMAFVFIMMFGVVTFAAGSSGSVSASNLIGKIVSVILSMFRWVGIVLLVWGVAQFVMAIKRTDAESKSDAIQTIICAIVLIGLKSIINSLGLGISLEDVDLG